MKHLKYLTVGVGAMAAVIACGAAVVTYVGGLAIGVAMILTLAYLVGQMLCEGSL